MNFTELTEEEFTNFVENHPTKNFFQSIYMKKRYDIEGKETDNLLDIIQMSYDADEIIKFIDKITPKIKENIDIKKSGVISEYIINYSNFIKDRGIDIDIKKMKDKKNINYKMDKLKDRKNSILEIISKGQ